MKHWILATVLVLGSGCDTNTEPAGQLAFMRDVDNTGYGTLVATQGAIEQRSSFYLPCVPYVLTAHLAERGPRAVEIHVVGETGTGCYTMVSSTDYLVRVTGLASGTYAVRVIHSWPDTQLPADTVANGTVVVP